MRAQSESRVAPWGINVPLTAHDSIQCKTVWEATLNREDAPETETFENWNVTRDGIIFNFDACNVLSCADGEQRVEIPFDELKPWLNSNRLQQPL